MTPVLGPQAFEELRPALEHRLREFLDAVGRETTSVAAAALPIVEQVRVLTLRGGKRFRAGFVLAGVESVVPWQRLGPAVLDVCVAVELFQTYLLIHDDWMDGDSMRRGGPTAHVALSEVLGDSARGAAAAVLAGDFASALAQSLLCSSAVPSERVPVLLRVFAALQREVMLGQTLDLLGEGALATMHDLKTCSYSVRGPLSLGVALAGGGPELLATLDAYSDPLGAAFQLRDDVLGAFGDVAHTGKGPFTDLERGKRNAVFERALTELPPGDATALRRLFGVVGADARDEARALFSRAGVRALLEVEISACRDRAIAALGGAALRSDGRLLLEHLARRVSDRSN